MDYSDAGVDVEASDAAVAALADAVDIEHGDYAGLVELDGRVLGLTTDGCGTKVLVAEAVGDYSTIGVDAVAMNANDLVAMNLRPLAFVDYLVVDEPSESLSREIGVGLRKGCESAGMRLVGGETAVMPEVVEGVDLAGSCVGVAAPDDVVDGSGVREGDAVVGLPSSGVHSNGLTLARKALTSEFDYDDRVPYADRSVGEELLTPTRIYGDVPDVAREHEVRGMAHVTGGGFTNLSRVSDHRYVVDDPLPVPDVFGLVADAGDVDRREMYRTFNMGMGFALVVEAGDADDVAEALDGSVVGYVDDGEGVEVDGLEV